MKKTFLLILMCVTCKVYAQNSPELTFGTYYRITTKEEFPQTSLPDYNYVLEVSFLQLKQDSTFSIKKYYFYSDHPTMLRDCDTTFGTFKLDSNKLILMSDALDIERKELRYPCLFFIEQELLILDKDRIQLHNNEIFTLLKEKKLGGMPPTPMGKKVILNEVKYVSPRYDSTIDEKTKTYCLVLDSVIQKIINGVTITKDEIISTFPQTEVEATIYFIEGETLEEAWIKLEEEQYMQLKQDSALFATYLKRVEIIDDVEYFDKIDMLISADSATYFCTTYHKLNAKCRELLLNFMELYGYGDICGNEAN